MNRENTSRSMRYYTIEYNRILHRLVYAVTSAPDSPALSYDVTVRLISECRAAICMAANVRRYVSDSRLRSLASEMSESYAGAINSLREYLEPFSHDTYSAHDILRFEKSMHCIFNSMLADMSERQFDSSIARRFIREALPLCKGISETASLGARYVRSDEPAELLCGIRAYGCKTVYTLEEIRADINE